MSECTSSSCGCQTTKEYTDEELTQESKQFTIGQFEQDVETNAKNASLNFRVILTLFLLAFAAGALAMCF